MKKLLAVVLTLIMVLSLTACGASMEGTYKLTDATGNEGIKEYLDMFGKKNMYSALIVDKDNKITMKMIGMDEQSGTYDSKEKKMKIAGDEATYTFEKDTITIKGKDKDQGNEYSFTFKKMTDEEKKAFGTGYSQDKINEVIMEIAKERLSAQGSDDEGSDDEGYEDEE